MPQQLTFGDLALELTFQWDSSSPVSLAGVSIGGEYSRVYPTPLVEVVTADAGHAPASARLAHTQLGTEFRFIDREVVVSTGGQSLRLRQHARDIEAIVELRKPRGVAAIHVQVTLRNFGECPVVLRSATSWTAGFTVDGIEGADPLSGWDRVSGTSDWLGEGRWSRSPLRGPDFPRLEQQLTGHNPRDAFVQASRGTWSTGKDLPVGAVVCEEARLCVAWQVEHNGAWRAEIGEDTVGAYIALSGPTDDDHSWTRVLSPDEHFTTVPVSVVWGADFMDAMRSLTTHRRLLRRPHPDNRAMPVVFNDYMNTLNGDPTTEKLLPLIAAAAHSGAEVFCIDAGWYDDSGYWWDSVGEWMPSATRFPGGLGEVIAAIRASGMTPGLWLEPEVVGIKSPSAETLPFDALLQRHGARVVEHDRYHLDLRHPAAVAHLDAVVDRLVADFGIGFFKFDYNVNPGPGTDRDADSVGDGLLQHNRAHLAWLDRLLQRHPDLVIENCASGAMRADFAMLSRLAMQSTSDQQDYTKYPPIAASAPMSMLPEQAASWAYPQPEMTDEQIAFCLVTGLLGRYYVSGYLNRMSEPQQSLVAEAIAAAKRLRHVIVQSAPVWPLGLPSWDDAWVAAGLTCGEADHVSVWRRDGAGDDTRLRFPHLAGRSVTVDTVFPTGLPAWDTTWDPTSGTLTVRTHAASVSARTLRLTPVPDHTAARPASQQSIDQP